ncbi:hypothetical protein [Parasphingorhabdus sp. NYA22]
MDTSHASCDIPADWINDFSQCLYEWQGIEAGALALLAALIGAIFLNRQISQNERHEVERIARQHKAVRATLPLALSGLCETMRQMLLELNDAKIVVRKQQYTKDFNPPATPDQHLSEFQAVIISTDAPSVVEPISEIIRQIQTLWSRVEVLQNKTEQERRAGLVENIDDWMIQSAQIHAMVESLFKYSRSVEEMGPSEVSWERVESVLFQLEMEDKELVKRINAYTKKSKNFWTLND